MGSEKSAKWKPESVMSLDDILVLVYGPSRHSVPSLMDFKPFFFFFFKVRRLDATSENRICVPTLCTHPYQAI
jgi:hypothetical protein